MQGWQASGKEKLSVEAAKKCMDYALLALVYSRHLMMSSSVQPANPMTALNTIDRPGRVKLDAFWADTVKVLSDKEAESRPGKDDRPPQGLSLSEDTSNDKALQEMIQSFKATDLATAPDWED